MCYDSYLSHVFVIISSLCINHVTFIVLSYPYPTVLTFSKGATSIRKGGNFQWYIPQTGKGGAVPDQKNLVYFLFDPGALKTYRKK